jgi:hypothetical protein
LNRLLLLMAAPIPALIVPPATLSPVAVLPDHQNRTIFGWKPTPVIAWSLPAVMELSRLNEPTCAS